MSIKTDVLLREILNAVQCNYMSDLHTVEFSDSAMKEIANIPDQKFELVAWKEAVCYITGEELDPKSVEEAKAMLKRK